MKKYFTGVALSLLTAATSIAQDSANVQPADTAAISIKEVDPRNPRATGEIYKIKKGVDIPIVLIAGGWSGYAFTKIYSKDPSTVEQIENLNRYDIARFNRPAIDRHNQKSEDLGDAIFYGSMPAPLLLMLDQRIRKDAGKIAFLFLESMTITGMPYTASVYFKDKYRPYAYNPLVPMDKRKRGGGKNSFYAGHPALVATSLFFMAKVYSDYHPNSGYNWVFFTLAAAGAGTVAYCRYDAGQHFPTDIMIGTTLGTLTGILVPHFHKNRPIKEKGLSVKPFFGESNGLTAVYRF